MKNLASDKDVTDFRLRMKRLHVTHNPLSSRIDVAAEHRDVAVGCGDGDGDAGVGKSLKDLRVHVVDLDAVYGGPCFEEVRHRGWRREVVAEGSVVDADGVDGGGEVEEEEEEERREGWGRHGFVLVRGGGVLELGRQETNGLVMFVFI